MTRRVWLCIICSPFTSNHIIRNIIEQPYWYVIYLHLFLLSMLFIRYHVFIYIYCTKINNSLRLYWFLFEVITCFFTCRPRPTWPNSSYATEINMCLNDEYFMLHLINSSNKRPLFLYHVTIQYFPILDLKSPYFFVLDD